MDTQNIINTLVTNNIISGSPVSCRPLTGGTASEVYLLNTDTEEYIIKGNDPVVIQSEAAFLQFYQDIHLLPSLLYTDESHHYLVYTFVEGTGLYAGGKKEMLQTLTGQLLNHYRAAESDGWGWCETPENSWQTFQTKEIGFAAGVIGSRLEEEDHYFVRRLSEDSVFQGNQYLIHGDCGIHNFIFKDDKLSGVIDPTPVIGDPVYDLIYAFCASPDDLTREVILNSFKKLETSQASETRLYEQVLIALYIRLETCLVHHPDDFPEYLNAWKYWLDIVKDNVE